MQRNSDTMAKEGAVDGMHITQVKTPKPWALTKTEVEDYINQIWMLR